MKALFFKRDLLDNVFCRIQPSPIHGVGVFAIRPIPQGINPMRECRSDAFEEISTADLADLPEPLQKLVKDMCPEHDGVYDVPPFSLNEIGVSYYLNHSKTPNMGERDGDFITLTEICSGEELTVDYGTYGELNL